MTREEAKELLPIIQAFAEGKTIQDWTNYTWKDKEYTSFGELSQSPIKPQPKYRPFDTKEECWNEMLKHQPFGWLKSIKKTRKVQIGRVFEVDGYVLITLSIKEGFAYSSHCIFNEYTFDDGTPFGIREE